MKKSLYSFLIVLAILPSISFAQTPFWTQTAGPTAGTVRDMCIDSSGRLIVWTSGGGVFRSEDKGATWHLLNRGLPNLNMRIGEAGASGYLYAANSNRDKQLFRFNENDPNALWEEITPNFGYLNMTSILADPSGPLFVSTTHTKLGVLRSDDKGKTWQSKCNGISGAVGNKFDSTVYFLALDTKGNIYAAQQSGTIWSSSDKGETWTKLGKEPGGPLVNALAVATNGNIIVGNWGGIVVGGKMYVSTNSGVSWDTVYTRPANTQEQKNHIDKIIRVPGSIVLYANAHGITLRSNDNGLIWTVQDSDKRGDEPFSMTAIGTDLYQLSEPDGIFHSNDNGVNWENKSVGLRAQLMWGIAINSKQHLFGITEYGLHRSLDQGLSWMVMPEYGETYFPSLFIDKHDSLFIGTDKGLFRSADDGVTLKRVVINIDPDTLNIIAQVGDAPWPGGKLYCSSLKTTIGFISSPDEGDHWDKVGGPWDNTTIITAFAFDPVNTIIAAAKPNNIYRSSNKGVNWEVLPVTAELDGTYQMLIHPDGSYLALVKSVTGGVYRSVDGGQTWGRIFPPEGRTFGQYYSMMIDDQGKILVCTDTGIWHSSNPSFTQWISKSSGLTTDDFPNHFISCSQVVENRVTKVFFGGSRGLSVFKSVPNLGVESQRRSPATSLTLQSYPNPFSTAATVNFTLDSGNDVSVEVFDVLGRQIKTILNEMLESGQHSVTFDGSEFPNGNYMITLKVGSTTQSTWVTLAK